MEYQDKKIKCVDCNATRRHAHGTHLFASSMQKEKSTPRHTGCARTWENAKPRNNDVKTKKEVT